MREPRMENGCTPFVQTLTDRTQQKSTARRGWRNGEKRLLFPNDELNLEKGEYKCHFGCSTKIPTSLMWT